MTLEQLKKMKKTELIELARSKKIEVSSRLLKVQLVETIHKALSPKRRPPAKKASRPQASGKAQTKTRKQAAKKPARAAKPKKTEKKPVPRRPVPYPAPELEDKTIRQKAVAEKYHLTTPVQTMPPVDSMDIPSRYDITRIIALVRDPHWIFAYWEITAERFRELENRYKRQWTSCRMILRVYDRTEKKSSYFDIETGPDARNWYINVSSGRSYQIAIGILDPSKRFEEIAISNLIETPRGTISDTIDDQWMVPEQIYERIFAASGGYDVQEGSQELQELIQKHMLEQMSSESVSSFGSGELRRAEYKRAFRLWVATELILYGATEPDARVTIQGKEIKLRGDGTFSLRVALPEGKIGLPVTALSADGVEERTIDTTVRKKSEQKEPIIR